MGYDVLGVNVRRLTADTTTGLPGGTVVLMLPPTDVPAAPNVLLVEAVDVMVDQDFPAVGVQLYDVDPTQGTSNAPAAVTRVGNDTGQGQIVIPAGANLWIVFSNVNAGVVPAARVQYALARPSMSAPGSTQPTSHPVLGG